MLFPQLRKFTALCEKHGLGAIKIFACRLVRYHWPAQRTSTGLGSKQWTHLKAEKSGSYRVGGCWGKT